MLGQEEDRDDFFAPMCSLLQECVKAVGRAGCKFIILRPLAVGIGDRDTWEANRACYLSLVDIAEYSWSRNIQIKNPRRAGDGESAGSSPLRSYSYSSYLLLSL